MVPQKRFDLDLIFQSQRDKLQPVLISIPAALTLRAFPNNPGKHLECINSIAITEEDLDP